MKRNSLFFAIVTYIQVASQTRTKFRVRLSLLSVGNWLDCCSLLKGYNKQAMIINSKIHLLLTLKQHALSDQCHISIFKLSQKIFKANLIN